jgi:outer membrane lipoprotein-sorting protein
MPLRRLTHTVFIGFLLITGTGCLFRSKPVQIRMSTEQLQNATRNELVARVNDQSSKINTMNATVDIDASTGGSKKGKITEYQQIRGYVLAQKPNKLRMIGLLPIVRNKAFDMVSDGDEFKVWIPPKNRFVIGHNAITKPSPSALENLRPQHINDALLLHEIDPQNEIAVLEGSNEIVQDPKTKKDVEQPNYILDIIRKDPEMGNWFLARKIYFARTTLLPYRQVVYDRNGYVATDASYDEFQPVDGVQFPRVIRIWRPQEEYTVTLHIVKLDVNKPMSAEQFALERPPGSTLVDLDNHVHTAGNGGGRGN